MVCAVLYFVVIGLIVLWGPAQFYLTPFRESQTAISASYLAHGESDWLRYETPVLGAPWSWPMEFPLYQWFVAWMHKAGMPLVWAGRILSVLCLVGCGWVAPRLLGVLVDGKQDWWWTRHLIWACPLLLVYGTAFLIESMALLASLTYAWLALVVLSAPASGSGREWRNQGPGLALGLTCGVVASLVKPTTWVPAAFLIGVVSACWLVVRVRTWPDRVRQILLTGVFLLVPLVIGLLWVRFADEVKAAHPVAASMVSAEMKSWNYGTLAQKLSPAVWGTILLRGWVLGLGPLGLLVPVLIVGAIWRLRSNLTVLAPAVALLAAYLVGPLIFTNLYFRHDYYSYANLAYLLLGLAVLAASCLPNRWAVRTGVSLGLSMGLTAGGYLLMKQRYLDPQGNEVVAILKRQAAPGAIGFLGFGYSAIIPYETGRRALMVDTREPDARFAAVMVANQGITYSTVVALDARYRLAGQAMAAGLGIPHPVETVMSSGVLVWTGEALAPGSPSESEALLAYIKKRVPEADGMKDGLLWLRPPFSNKLGHGFELIYKRRTEAFVVRSADFHILRIRGVWAD